MEKLCFTKQNNTFEWKNLVLLSKTKLFRETLENLQKTKKTKKTNNWGTYRMVEESTLKSMSIICFFGVFLFFEGFLMFLWKALFCLAKLSFSIQKYCFA